MFRFIWFLNDILSQTSLQTGFIIVLTFLLFVHLMRSLLDIPLVDDISDKCIFITGCDTGFGYILALKLDTLGCSVFAGCLTQDGANRLSEASDNRIATLILDVTNSDSITRAKKVIEEHLSERGKGKSWLLMQTLQLHLDHHFHAFTVHFLAGNLVLRTTVMHHICTTDIILSRTI